MAKPGWSPVTMTLTNEVIEELESRRDARHKSIGKVADAALRHVFFDAPEPPIDQEEMFRQIDQCIAVHWHGNKAGFFDALSSLMGTRFVHWDLAQWKRSGRVPAPIVPWIETLLTITDNLPKPPTP
jgi:hypothetical protein